MIKLKDLITENIIREYGEYHPITKEIDKQTALNLLATDYSTSTSRPVIYKGFKNFQTNFAFTQPSLSFRPSKNTNNIYTTLLAILPSWKDYPKRTRSLICTSHRGTARAFGGKVYRVYPKNGARIGICPSDDMWISFPRTLGRMDFNDMNSFNSHFYEFFRDLSINYELYFRMTDEKHMEDFLKELDEKIKLNVVRELDENEYYYIVRDLHQNFKTNWTDYFDELLNPDSNGFKVKLIEDYDVGIKSDNFGSYEDREVWTDADSVLVWLSDSGVSIR